MGYQTSINQGAEHPLLKNVSAKNLQRLFAQLIHPDTRPSVTVQKLGDCVMKENRK